LPVTRFSTRRLLRSFGYFALGGGFWRGSGHAYIRRASHMEPISLCGRVRIPTLSGAAFESRPIQVSTLWEAPGTSPGVRLHSLGFGRRFGALGDGGRLQCPRPVFVGDGGWLQCPRPVFVHYPAFGGSRSLYGSGRPRWKLSRMQWNCVLASISACPPGRASLGLIPAPMRGGPPLGRGGRADRAALTSGGAADRAALAGGGRADRAALANGGAADRAALISVEGDPKVPSPIPVVPPRRGRLRRSRGGRRRAREGAEWFGSRRGHALLLLAMDRILDPTKAPGCAAIFRRASLRRAKEGARGSRSAPAGPKPRTRPRGTPQPGTGSCTGPRRHRCASDPPVAEAATPTELSMTSSTLWRMPPLSRGCRGASPPSAEASGPRRVPSDSSVLLGSLLGGLAPAPPRSERSTRRLSRGSLPPGQVLPRVLQGLPAATPVAAELGEGGIGGGLVEGLRVASGAETPRPAALGGRGGVGVDLQAASDAADLPPRPLAWAPGPEELEDDLPPTSLAMRLRARAGEWGRLAGTRDEAALQAIRSGVRIEWTKQAPRPFHGGVSSLGPEEEAWFSGVELPRNLESGAWSLCPPHERTHVCRMFCVPKPTMDGMRKFRVIHDLRPVNEACGEKSCKYDGLGSLEHLLSPGESMFSLDLQDGYHAVAVAPEFRRYFVFGVQVGGEVVYVKCNVLPFGWNASPHWFCRCMAPFVGALRAPASADDFRSGRVREWARAAREDGLAAEDLDLEGLHDPGGGALGIGPMRVLAYLDDFLILARSRAEALAFRARLDGLLQRLGLARNPRKGSWEPTTELEHLGMWLNSVSGCFSLTKARVAKLRRLARDLRIAAAGDSRRVPRRLLEGFVGLAQASYLAVPSARFFLRSMHQSMREEGPWRRRFVRLSNQALRDLRFWEVLPPRHTYRSIWRPLCVRVVHTDASSTGYGGALQHEVVDGVRAEMHGVWTEEEQQLPINILELRALRLAIERWAERLRGCVVRCWNDNMTVVAVVRGMTSRSPVMMEEVRRLWHVLDKHDIQLRLSHIPGVENELSDALSRFASSAAPPGEYRVSQPVFNACAARWGLPVADAFASPTAHMLPTWWARAPLRGAAAVDAFSQLWGPGLVWLHPHPNEILGVVQRLLRERERNVVLLTPRWPRAAWWPLLSFMIPVRQRVEFPPGALLPLAPDTLQVTFWRVTAWRLEPRSTVLARYSSWVREHDDAMRIFFGELNGGLK
jgi:hypothetical protein